MASTLSIVLSFAAPLLTVAGAVLWAGYIAPEVADPERQGHSSDIRTW